MTLIRQVGITKHVRNQGILSIPGIAGYEWVPARIGCFGNKKIFIFKISMADLKQEKRVLIRQTTLPLFSVPWGNIQQLLPRITSVHVYPNLQKYS